MYRLIIILVLLIILFYMIRRAVQDWRLKHASGALPGKDVMVQDPVCKVYIPVGAAVIEHVGGQRYYFCSEECARAFEQESSRAR
ncbi:MAG: YHS domain-containing protein [Nitrospirae bacterium]|nr:MAG: YHS domain-containing protein [Nitrospirota bacterium]